MPELNSFFRLNPGVHPLTVCIQAKPPELGAGTGDAAGFLSPCGASDHSKTKRKNQEMKPQSLKLPCVSLGAEYLVMGYLLRRNIMTFKAPEGNNGYDLLCINPDPLIPSKSVRVQVKSRYQSDSDGGFSVKEDSIKGFDFLVVAFLNIGSYFRNKGQPNVDGRKEPVFYTFTSKWVQQHHKVTPSGRGSIYTRNLDIEKFKGDSGFEAIAKLLKIEYPSK